MLLLLDSFGARSFGKLAKCQFKKKNYYDQKRAKFVDIVEVSIVSLKSLGLWVIFKCLAKWEVGKMKSWQNGKLVEWQVDKILDFEMKRDIMASWWYS